MSLLSDLTIAYEVLADDPIEQGIRYGHSVLDALSAKIITPRLPEPVLETAAAYSYKMPITESVITQPQRTEVQPRIQSRLRRESAGYSSRGFKTRSSVDYTRRAMVGSL